MNLNTAPAQAVGLVGYLPSLEVSNTLRSLPTFKECEHYVLQQCIGHVLTLIEDRARDGFTAHVGGRLRLLFPRLGAMTLDTKERVKYFGLRSDRTCGFCRLRHGRSVTRKSHRQSSKLLDLYFGWATRAHCNQVQISQRSKARKTLARHGWVYKKHCRLHHFASRCLVNIQRFGDVPYAGLLHYDRMHTFFLNYCTYCMELLAELVIDPVQVSRVVRRCHQFRDPHTGVTHPRLPSLLKMTHYTAERRVRAIFYWAHVLGTNAEVIVPEMRIPSQVAVATLQLLLIATRGHRPYTERELDTIFIENGTQFFRSLEQMAACVERKRMANGEEAHRRQPDRLRRPLPYKRPRRFVLYVAYMSACGSIFADVILFFHM